MGKLNFWQWLGVVLLIIGIVWWIVRDDPKKDQDKKPNPNPAAPTPAFSQPATPPATQPGG
jgi:hypothetical protein